MAVKITKDFVPVDGKYRSGKKLRKFKGITIHETGNFNKNSNAKSHNTYFHNLVKNKKNSAISYHYFVDDKEAFLELPTDEVAWTCGDGGNGTGNNETISIEICVNPECNLNIARDNGAYLAAFELKGHGIKKVVDGLQDKASGNLFQHYSWTKKNCPYLIRKENRWDSFVAAVQKHLDELWCVAPPRPTGLYKVQVGAFASKANANEMIFKLQALGYHPFSVTVGNLQKVQVGAFKNKVGAEELKAELIKKGFSAIIV